ncbi:glycohydrolase toxin TNT-related protein [Amycolatopsis thermalba]|uniref:Glycohydrolase toxin TNT-related protein n=1 Tax=Amycolatopsis thermalba TaxID=944492 RepID=A0ABY4NP99_9PSEU|nr:glycohydrolase toxin TNT-related protein [Amycolatopsis thermalba]UQS22488.1 glycohydrolase toxin TNT-related protein [Amycolatopsis thermalba]
MAQPTTQLNATEQDTLVKQIGLALLRAAPRDWRRVTATYRAVGRYHELSGEVLLEDGSAQEWMATHDIATLFGRLRAGMYREGRGTWFNARYQLDHPSSYNLEYDRDEPRWDLMPPPQAYADELRMFPRSEDNVPEWLMRRMAGLAPEQPGPRFRIARIFDGHEPSGRPVLNRPELDADEQQRVLEYLNNAPVVRAERGFDLDRLAQQPAATVPVAFHTDGVWIWPAAVNYYLQEYGVAPEAELVAHIAGHGHTLPEVPEQTVQAAGAYLSRGPAQPARRVPEQAPPPAEPAPEAAVEQPTTLTPVIDPEAGPPTMLVQPAVQDAEPGSASASAEDAGDETRTWDAREAFADEPRGGADGRTWEPRDGVGGEPGGFAGQERVAAADEEPTEGRGWDGREAYAAQEGAEARGPERFGAEGPGQHGYGQEGPEARGAERFGAERGFSQEGAEARGPERFGAEHGQHGYSPEGSEARFGAEAPEGPGQGGFSQEGPEARGPERFGTEGRGQHGYSPEGPEARFAAEAPEGRGQRDFGGQHGPEGPGERGFAAEAPERRGQRRFAEPESPEGQEGGERGFGGPEAPERRPRPDGTEGPGQRAFTGQETPEGRGQHGLTAQEGPEPRERSRGQGGFAGQEQAAPEGRGQHSAAQEGLAGQATVAGFDPRAPERLAPEGRGAAGQADVRRPEGFAAEAPEGRRAFAGPEGREQYGIADQEGPDQRGFTGQGGSDQHGFADQEGPDQRGFTGPESPGQRAFTGQGSPSQHGFADQEDPDQRGIAGQGGPDHRDFAGQEGPGPRGFADQEDPDQRGIAGQGGPDHRDFAGQEGPGPRGFAGPEGRDPRGFTGQEGRDQRAFASEEGPEGLVGHEAAPEARGFGSAPGGFAPQGAPAFAGPGPRGGRPAPDGPPTMLARPVAPPSGPTEPALDNLRAKLSDLGVPDAAYRIGEPAEHGWSLEKVDDGWRVGWYDETLTSPAVFGDADDAAAFMLGKLLLSPGGRITPPARPEMDATEVPRTPAQEPSEPPRHDLPQRALSDRLDEPDPAGPPTMLAPPVAPPPPAPPRREPPPRRVEPAAPAPAVATASAASGGGNQQWPIQPLPGEPPLTLFRGKEMRELPAGSELDRFGGPNGNLTYAAGTPFEERSLVPEWVNRPYHVYRVQRPIEALAGVAIPWFNQPGGGAAYLLPASIEDLLASGDLIELDPGEPPID